MSSSQVSIDIGDYSFQADPRQGYWRFTLSGTGSILEMAAAMPLTPKVEGVSVDQNSVTAVMKDISSEFRFVVLSAALKGKISGTLVNELYFLDRRMICNSYYFADAKHKLEAWILGHAGSHIEADSIHAYLGNPELMENGQLFSPESCDISTASHNWLYSPMVPRLLFNRKGRFVCIGGTNLSHDYGLKLKLEEREVKVFSFDYGGREAPFVVNANLFVHGPRLQLLVSSGTVPDKAQAEFTQAMLADGILSPKKYSPEDAVWRKPWYCSWGDQMALDKKNPNGVMSAEFVRRAAVTMRSSELNFGVFVIDEGWQDKRGDWNLNTGRIENMRSLVASLHDMDFKVVLWWAPFLVADDAEILKKQEWVYYSDRLKVNLVNYTNPEVRKYMSDKLDLWINDDYGWNIDGIKLDFMVERVFPEMRCFDPEWRGEERLMHHLFQMVDHVFLRYGKSPGILGEAYNPFLSQYCMAFQFEERFDSKLGYIDTRPAMAEALIPGAWLIPHFTYHQDITPEFIGKVLNIGGIPQIGKILEPGVDTELLVKIKDALLPAKCVTDK